MSSEGLRLIAAAILVAAVLFYAFRFYAEVIEFVEDTLVQNIKVLFADPKTKILFSVFYKYDHATTEEWFKWLQTTKPAIQDKAYTRIKKHLSEAPQGTGMAAQEIIKALLMFEHEDSFDVLKDLILNCRTKWLDHKATTVCYEKGSLGLMTIDPDKGQSILMTEFSETGDGREDHRFRRYLVDALALMNNKTELAQFYRTIAFDPKNPPDLKIQTLNLLEVCGNEAVYLKYLHELIDTFTSDDPSEHEEMLAVCLERYLDSTSNTAATELAWKTIYQFSTDNVLAPIVATSIANKAKDKNFTMNHDWLFAIYMNLTQEARELLEEALIFSYAINDQEQGTIAAEKEFQKFTKSVSINPKAVFSFIENEKSFKLYRFVAEHYKKFHEAVEVELSSLKVITGSSSLDKLLMAKEYSKDKCGRTMCINAALLMLSPDKVVEIDKLVDDEKPKLLYYYNGFDFLKTLAKQPDNELATNVLDFIKRHSKDQGTKTVIALDKERIELETNFPEIVELLNSGTTFREALNMGAITHEEKKEIYEYYEIILSQSREARSTVGAIKISQHTEGLGCTDFMQYCLEFISRCILTQGKLIPLEKYDALVARDFGAEEAIIETPDETVTETLTETTEEVL